MGVGRAGAAAAAGAALAAARGRLVGALAIFQHANLRTPRWLGVLVQRPESQRLHHARGLHRHHYADLPLIDMLFGSLRNPHDFPGATGFWPGASARVADILMWRDVSTPPAGKA